MHKTERQTEKILRKTEEKLFLSKQLYNYKIAKS